jgi:hypothetical protein
LNDDTPLNMDPSADGTSCFVESSDSTNSDTIEDIELHDDNSRISMDDFGSTSGRDADDTLVEDFDAMNRDNEATSSSRNFSAKVVGNLTPTLSISVGPSGWEDRTHASIERVQQRLRDEFNSGPDAEYHRKPRSDSMSTAPDTSSPPSLSPYSLSASPTVTHFDPSSYSYHHGPPPPTPADQQAPLPVVECSPPRPTLSPRAATYPSTRTNQPNETTRQTMGSRSLSDIDRTNNGSTRLSERLGLGLGVGVGELMMMQRSLSNSSSPSIPSNSIIEDHDEGSSESNYSQSPVTPNDSSPLVGRSSAHAGGFEDALPIVNEDEGGSSNPRGGEGEHRGGRKSKKKKKTTSKEKKRISVD